MTRHRRHMRTGEVAQLLGVSSRTVSKWCDSGKLKGYRLPLADNGKPSDRRFYREDIREFALRYGLTHTVEEMDRQRTVFLCGVAAPLSALLRPLLGQLLGDLPVLEGSLYDAGWFARDPPFHSVAVLDASLGRGACLTAAVALCHEGVRVIGLAAEDETAEDDWMAAGCAVVLKQPVDPGQLAREIQGQDGAP